MESKKIIIFTPTFNRAHTLERCYESIAKQSNDDVTWLVIDDGSTDGTSDLISSLSKRNGLKIIYLYQDNAGKQACWNRAVKFSQSYDIFICLDSDDILYDNVFNRMEQYYSLMDENDVIGLRCLAIRNSTKLPDSNYMLNRIYKDFWYKEIMDRKMGERVDLFNPKILAKYVFPVNESIKFIPESWMYSEISKKYKFIYIPEPIIIFYDEHNHIRLSKSSLKKNAKGQNIARRAVLVNVPMKVWLANPLTAAKHIIRYIQTSFYILSDYLSEKKWR
ncbi:glycosyltransferase family 2 protein [Edwardsiella tarda]|uniref:glycosyltransferase family 2 protein n=1 Tax=Edwardsiella tarda TaxID=636 RepID=UPI0009C051B5|nr:glycosyltransferase family A protein [Edwardsiella tarda]